MKRKRRNNKGKKGSHNASGSMSSRKDGQKTNKSDDGGGTSPSTQISTRPEDSVNVSSNQELQADQDHLSTTEPQSFKAEAQTQTEKIQINHRETQTESVSYISRYTQVETDILLEGNVSVEKKEEKSAEDSMDVSAADPGVSQKKDPTTPSDSGGEKKLKSEKSGLSEDLQNSSDAKSTDRGAKSYAEVASTCERNKDSKEQSNQATARQEGGKGVKSTPPQRGPPEKPMFTFYVTIILDKTFKFKRETDKLVLCHENGFIEMEITYSRDVHKDGYLIEANFLVEECDVSRGSLIKYNYAVQRHGNKMNEIAIRALRVPYDVKEMHLFEPYVTRSVPGFFKSFITSPESIISNAWQRSSRVFLDRLFEKWDPSNQESIQTFTQLLRDYQRDFQAIQRVVYENNLSAPNVKVNELIAKKLVNILKREMGGSPSESSVDVISVTVGLSVFQVCCGCNVELGIKDWAMICKQVSSDAALRQMGELQNTFPSLQYTVIGLMNNCARQLLSEVLLLVPLLYSVRQLGAESGRLGPTVEEPNWLGLQGVEYRLFRERIRTYSDKRSMMMELVQGHTSLAEGKPHIFTSWLSMMAFEDMTKFAELTKIVPELLIQSLMYRLKEFELNQSNDFERSQKNLKVTEGVLNYILTCAEQDNERSMGSELVGFVFQCCKNLHKSICRIARSTSMFKAAVLSFQLVLKMAEIQNQAFSKDEKENDLKKKELLTQLETIRKEFSDWRDGLLQRPLLKNSNLTYPSEIELWNALFGLDCSMEFVTDQWTTSVERDLRKRISELSDEEKIQICSVETSAKAIKKSHNSIQVCFQDMCQSAIKNICKAGKERSLVKSLISSLKSIDSSILSSIVVESAVRFRKDPVAQLLDAQSAIHVLLSQGHWNLEMNEDAKQVMTLCQSTLLSLVTSLCEGDILFGHLQTILKDRQHFKELFKQCKKNCKLEKISIDVEGLLTQRAKDAEATVHWRAHMGFFIKMIGKISERIHVPELSLLEEEHHQNLQSVSLNALVETHPCYCNDHLKEISTGQVLYYSADLTVLDTAQEMHGFQNSSLVLKSWTDMATTRAPHERVSLSLHEVIYEIWQPSVDDFTELGRRIACGTVTFEEVDNAVVGCEDGGDGAELKRELNLMATRLERYSGLERNWPEERLSQIQEYRQLHQAAASANAILIIRDKLNLQGDFGQINSLTQLKEDSFKKKTLGSLSNDLISAKQKLLIVSHQHTACLEAFVKSETLVKWVKSSITNLSELKVFMDLASISAGENDIEIDRLAGFGDAIVGYSPLLFSLRKMAGFDEFLVCAQQVWDKLKVDEKLPEKMEHSSRCLDWLKGLKETHGSVEKSSLSLVSAINTSGVYYIGWPGGSTGKKCLGNILHAKVTNHGKDTTYSLDELLELQNKLMLISSKGQQKTNKVNKFTEIFEGVQRMGRVLMQLCSSGNIFFREMKALVKCNPENAPCINIHFPLLEKNVVYQGTVAEELQEVCRSMEACHKDWRNFMTEVRSRYYALNHYTSEQVVYLGLWIKDICERGKPVPQQVWHLLTALKPDATLCDIKSAYEKAKNSSELHLPVQASTSELQEDTDGDEMTVEGQEEGLEPYSDEQDYNMEEALVETLEDLWKLYRNDMPRYLSQYTDIETLAQFLSSLSAMNQLHIKRRLPSTFQEGKPNLVLCSAAELIVTTLSVYIESSEQAFPSMDEVLMCHEDTTEEEVEIFLRRCLGQGGPRSSQKTYTLFNPGLLTYDVSVALVEHFEAMERSAGSHYRLVLVCPANQDRYVPSFFSNYKVQAGLTVSAERAKEYLRSHLSVRSSDFPGGLSAWLVTSKRPAVGKSLCVTRMFQRFKKHFPNATYLPVRLIEPCVVIDKFVHILDEKLSQLREHDPVLLHIDSAAVQKGLEEFVFRLLVLGCLVDSEGKLWRRTSAQFIAIEALLLDPGQNRQTQTEV